MSRRKRSAGWKRQGCYAWWVRKPHALLGLPIIGRHCGYVGQSSSFFHRDAQHMGRDTRYGQPGASWNDLEPKVHRLWCPFPQWRWCRLAAETVYTALLCPVYPEQKQPPWNLRKIGKKRAASMREARDRRRAQLGWRRYLVDILVTLGRMIVVVAILAAAIWMVMRWESI